MCDSSMKMKARAWAKDLSTKAVSLMGEREWGDESFVLRQYLQTWVFRGPVQNITYDQQEENRKSWVVLESG